jgi:hypothetical protein
MGDNVNYTNAPKNTKKLTQTHKVPFFQTHPNAKSALLSNSPKRTKICVFVLMCAKKHKNAQKTQKKSPHKHKKTEFFCLCVCVVYVVTQYQHKLSLKLSSGFLETNWNYNKGI